MTLKQELESSIFAPHDRGKQTRLLRFTTVFLLGIASLHLLLERPLPFRSLIQDDGKAAIGTKPFQWKNVKPSTSFEWTACFEEFKCARLDVPLDWTAKDKSKGTRAAVAVVRVPAKVAVTDPRYGGAVLINPGGPGGSGASMAIMSGRNIQTILDSPKDPLQAAIYGESKYFDIIGFDPRGVGETTPSTGCFPDDISYGAWSQQAKIQGPPHSNESFANSWSRSVGLAQSCTWRLGDAENEGLGIGRYLGTPSVVEDMVAIIEALGEWRETTAIQTRKAQRTMANTAIPNHAWKKGEEKLLYWGFSYGTLLGATFATIHPERVGRVVLDGVVDADDYYNATWIENLEDTSSIVESLLKQCYEAGPIKCALYRSSLEKVRDLYFGTLAKLKEDPIPVPAHGDYGPEIITYQDISQLIIATLYSPIAFPMVATLIQELSVRNGTSLAEIKRVLTPSTCPSPLCLKHPWSSDCYASAASSLASAQSAILCGDGVDITNWTREDHYRKWKILESQSTAFAPYWTEITMPCSNWGLRPAWKFNSSISANHTAHPILFLSNTRDPVTPLRNAWKMTKRFPGSVVFGQDADGHCTISAPSVCVAKGIRGYFHHGELPKGGMRCKPDRTPFNFLDSEEVNVSEADISIAKATRQIAEMFRERKSPLGIL